MLQRVHSGCGCNLASTLCQIDLSKGDLFVLSWARVRRVRWGNISSKLLMCGGGVHSILPFVARCMDTIDKYNSLQAVELSGHQICKLLSSHPFKLFS